MPTLRFSDASVEAMRTHRWPGNVRELENAVERAAILRDGDVIEPAGLALDSARSPDDADRSIFSARRSI
jgi:DNA-binding NtrC family response regulator